MAVSIDTFSNKMNQLEPIMIGVVEAVKEYVSKEKAELIFKNVEPAIKEQVELRVKEYVEKQVLMIMSKVDIETMAKLATIGAAKEIGKELA